MSAPDNAELVARLERRNEELSLLNKVARESVVRDLPRLLHTTLHALAHLAQADLGAVHLLEGEAGEMVLAAEVGATPGSVRRRIALGEGPLGRALQAGQAVRGDASKIPLPDGVQCGISQPLLLRGTVLGAIGLGRRRPVPFDDAAAALLETAAAQLVVSLENARLYQDAQRQLRELELVGEVGQAIAGTLDLQAVLGTAASRLARIAGASGCDLFLADDRRVALVRWGHAGEPQGGPAHGDADGIHRCMAERVPVIGAEGGGAWLVLPLLHRDRLVGVARLTAEGGQPFGAEVVARGQAITNQVAAAVENARLYDDLKRSYEALERAQGQLVKRERLAALGELAAVVAHEVRNPLGVIFNSVSSLKRMLRPGGDVAALLEIVGEEADRLNRIVGDMLDFSRVAEPAMAPADLGKLLDEVLATARGAAPAGLAIQMEIASDLPKVPMDARLVRQALLNVVLNAVQAMPRGGLISLRAGAAQEGGRKVARVEIADTGVGIPEELCGRIFEPFFTTKATGTGLGLAVVRRIVEDHRGEVRVRSRVGEGTTFTVILPLDFTEPPDQDDLAPRPVHA